MEPYSVFLLNSWQKFVIMQSSSKCTVSCELLLSAFALCFVLACDSELNSGFLLKRHLFFFCFNYLLYLFNFWLHWVFVAVHGLLIAVASLVADHRL